MKEVKSTLALLLLAAGCLPLFSQPNFDKVEIKSTAVAGAVHMLEGQGGNIGVSAGDDGLLIIDTQFAPLADKIEAALEGLGKGEVKMLLNTHWHGDHTGGNAHFGKYVPIIAQNNVRKRLDNGRTDKAALPVITYDQSLTLYFNGEEIKVMHVQHGHTDGDSIIFFTKSNVVHMGDQFFSGKFPYIDLSSGGDVAGYIQNVANILQQLPDDVKIIPGHGPLSTKADLKTFHEMLVDTTGIIRKRMADGQTAEQIKQAGLPDKYKDWGTGFINAGRWIDIVMSSYAK